MGLSKQILSKLPESIQAQFHQLIKTREIKQWKKRSKNSLAIATPLAIKENIINKYKSKYEIDTFIETGTSYGDMVWRQRNNFSTIYSIELGVHLAQFSRKRFQNKKHIHIIQGNSNTRLGEVLNNVPTQAIIYLDAHYTGPDCVRGYKDCVVSDELPIIVKTGIEHIIIINDAHLFKGERDYPAIEAIEKYILKNNPLSTISVEDDCIVIELKAQTNDIYIDELKTEEDLCTT